MNKTIFFGFGACIVLSIATTTGCGDEGSDTSAGSSGGQGGAAASAGSGATTMSTTGSTGAGSGGSQAGGPDEAFLPKPWGTCPDFAEGTITVTADGVSRQVQIWMSDAAKTMDGPLIFYWHGTGSMPAEAAFGIGTANVAAIKAKGGIIAAPYHDPAAGTFPWYLTAGGTNEIDMRVADEVLACAIEKVGIDKRHIHSMGMSAGGLNTTQMSYRRSGYLASVVTYSGGLLGMPPDQDPSNKFAAMIFHGGMSDMVVIGFQAASEAYRDALKNAGHFAFICDHGMGHSIPTAAVDSVQKFFDDHPFGTDPSPYVSGLPAGFPAYCAL